MTVQGEDIVTCDDLEGVPPIIRERIKEQHQSATTLFGRASSGHTGDQELWWVSEKDFVNPRGIMELDGKRVEVREFDGDPWELEWLKIPDSKDEES